MQDNIIHFSYTGIRMYWNRNAVLSMANFRTDDVALEL
jgi:hypothetical protein